MCGEKKTYITSIDYTKIEYIWYPLVGVSKLKSVGMYLNVFLYIFITHMIYTLRYLSAEYNRDHQDPPRFYGPKHLSFNACIFPKHAHFISCSKQYIAIDLWQYIYYNRSVAIYLLIRLIKWINFLWHDNI